MFRNTVFSKQNMHCLRAIASGASVPKRVYPCLLLGMCLWTWNAPLASGAEAQSICGPRKDLIEALARRYQEEPRAIGIMSSNGLIEVFASQAGSWTMLVTQPQGVSCIMAAGHSWGEAAPPRNLTGS